MPHLAEGNKYWWLSLSTYFFSSINHPILMREKGAWNEGGRLQRDKDRGTKAKIVTSCDNAFVTSILLA